MLDDTQKILRQARRTTISELRKMFSPHMWESCFRVGTVGNSRPLKLWAPRNSKGALVTAHLKSQALSEVYGVSENGVITDAYGGACVTQAFADFSLEDLLLLKDWGAKALKDLAPKCPADGMYVAA